MKKVLARGGRWSAQLRYKTKSGEEKKDISDPGDVEKLIRDGEIFNKSRLFPVQKFSRFHILEYYIACRKQLSYRNDFFKSGLM